MKLKTKLTKHKAVTFGIIIIIVALIVSTAALYRYNQSQNNTEADKTSAETETIVAPNEEEVLEPVETVASDDEDLDTPLSDEEAGVDEISVTTNPPPAAPTPSPAKPADWWAYPAVILPTTRDGNDLLVLVNKQYQLPSTYAPTDLVTLENVNIRLVGAHNIRSLVVSDLTNLGNAAKAAGLDLSIKSSYRSYSTQASTYQYWVNYNGGNTAAADTVSARPGHSQHQLGTTVDFSSSEVNDQIGAVFNSTQAAAWLQAHAWEYGFALAYPAGAETVTGYSPEAWHYRYIGRENSTSWHNSGLILETWLRQQNGV